MNRIIVLVLALTACADLDPPTLIKRDRVLGAKVTVDTDPDRAWPAPGETATVTWVTASPGDPATFSWILGACPAATSTGLPICAGPMFAGSQDTGTVPQLHLAIPAQMSATAIVVTGAICATGTPIVDADAQSAECSDGSRPDVVSQHVFLSSDAATNHNPALAGAPFTASGEDWNATAAASCDDLPQVEAGGDRVLIGVTFDAADRETFVSRDAAEVREELKLSAFATAGEIIQQHTFVDAVDARETTPVALEWDPPAADEVPAEGLRVKFHFVVRDQRGGVDAAVRELCVR